MATWTQLKRLLVEDHSTENEDFTFRVTRSGGEITRWNVPGVRQPTIEDIEAKGDSDAWYAARRLNQSANMDGFNKDMRAVIKAFISVLNTRLLVDITEEELRQAIDTEYRSL